MNIKYRDKIYSSEDVPLFVYFKTDANRREFINILQHYVVGTYCRVNCIQFVLAGKAVIKDKRAVMYFCIIDKVEKRTLQRNLFNVPDEDNNAMMCAPADIDENILLDWVQKHLEELD